ncbi:hypothetical protein ACFQH3_16065 [Haladaptatus sp. GCM10025707]|uniref:HVO_0234 family beta-propeller protein n=1 Tax=unclassified Haladaptatus TaxID=2622732 RepID=UPI0023E7F67C|nr:hypothetical protein [Haladaptatus sp. QDMS2]
MQSLEEKRVFGEKTGKTVVLAATDVGVAAVSIAGAQVGQTELLVQCAARDVAANDEQVAVATEEDVLVHDGEEFVETGFGPATAVEFNDGVLLAGGPAGTLARYATDWSAITSLSGRVNAISGNLVATDDGVCQVTTADCIEAGLESVRDVSTAGTPHAATADGLYYLGNGWMQALEGDFTMVATAEDGRAHAATADKFYAADEEWDAVSLPTSGQVADAAYDAATYAATVDGTFLADAGESWRTHPLGLRDVHALCVL